HPPRKAARDLARHLKPFEVRPKDVRVPDGRKGKGYDRADFEDAFARYLQPSQRDNATTQQGQRSEAPRHGSGDASNETTEAPGAHGCWRCLLRDRSTRHDGAPPGPPAQESEGAGVPRCPRCGGAGWTPPLNGGPGHCLCCGDTTCLDREPGSDDGENDEET